jgi:ribosomal protein L37AE/L43A
MIELTPNTALMLYLCMTLTVLLGIWGWQHLSSRKNKVVINEQELLVCEYCNFAYMDQIGKPVTACPQCGSFNKKNNYPGSK